MTGWLMVAAYGVGFLFTYRKVFLLFMQHEGSVTDPMDRVTGAFLGFISSLLWPIALTVYLLWRFNSPLSPKERKHQLDEREAHIRRMERDLGIGRDGR